jgi:prolipoprotein diacylglyceryltransferase
MLYTAGRVWIENLRVDDVQMNDVLGLRLNVWTSIVLFVVAAAFLAWSLWKHPGREEQVRTGPAPDDGPAEESGTVSTSERDPRP